MAFLKADMPMAPYVDIFTGDLERLGAGERYDTNRLWAEPGGGIRGGRVNCIGGGVVVGCCEDRVRYWGRRTQGRERG